jgi:hypothetical protein
LKISSHIQGSPRMKKTKVAVAGIAAALIGSTVLCEPVQAVAMPITGSIEFVGSASPTGSSPGTPVTIQFSNPWKTLMGTGSYSGVPAKVSATFVNFSFTGEGLMAALSAAVTPLWTFDSGGKTFSFDLEHLTNGHTDSGSMNFTGTGTAHITGFDDTFATWGLQGSGQNFDFQISTSTTAAQGSVPDNGPTVALLAVGLTAIVMFRRQIHLG